MLQLVNRHGNEPLSWDDFCATHPRYSIALDGYVSAGSMYDASGPWLNLDHHADVDRLATRATCAQVLLCLRQGLLTSFRDHRGPRAIVYVNDCDEDVCLSWFLLSQSPLALAANAPRLDELVQAVDILDTTAGAALRAIDDRLLRELAWVFQPYRQARQQGGLDLASNDVAREVIDAVTDRIGAHLANAGDQLPLNGRYDVIGGGPGWHMVQEIGSHSRLAMGRDGVHAYVSLRPRSPGNWNYTVGRVSPFVPFDVPAIIEQLNQREPPGRGKWGGGSLIGGSPRRHGSQLSPSQVTSIVNEVASGDRLLCVAKRSLA